MAQRSPRDAEGERAREHQVQPRHGKEMRQPEQPELIATQRAEPAAIAQRQRREQRPTLPDSQQPRRRVGAECVQPRERPPWLGVEQAHDEIGMGRRCGRADAAPREIAAAIAAARIGRVPRAHAAGRAGGRRSPATTLASGRPAPTPAARSRSRIRSGTTTLSRGVATASPKSTSMPPGVRAALRTVAS